MAINFKKGNDSAVPYDKQKLAKRKIFDERMNDHLKGRLESLVHDQVSFCLSFFACLMIVTNCKDDHLVSSDACQILKLLVNGGAQTNECSIQKCGLSLELCFITVRNSVYQAKRNTCCVCSEKEGRCTGRLQKMIKHFLF